MQSLLGKRMAKELHILRYIPERKVYEMQVEWESEASPSTFFLSEIFLYPYSLRTSRNQPKNNSPPLPQKERTPDSNGFASPKSKIEGAKTTNQALFSCQDKQKAQISHLFLDYDSFCEPAVMKQSMNIKKNQVVLHRPNKIPRKKRKT